MKKYQIGVVALGMLLTACSEEPDVSNAPIGKIETPAEVEVSIDETEDVQVFYQVPTPDELFDFIKSVGSEPRFDILNSPENLPNYLNNKAKALNFGVYSTDLAYASSYKKGTETLRYYGCIRKLGDELDISSVFNEGMRERIESNLDRTDSLLELSNDTYFSAYNYLERNDRGPALALVVTGGWLESLYIVTNLINEFDAESEVVQRLADQKYSLENLIDFMMKYKDDEGVAQTLEEVKQLQVIFNEITEEKIEIADKTEGLPSLGGGEDTRLAMTAENYTAIKTTLNEMRNTFTANN